MGRHVAGLLGAPGAGVRWVELGLGELGGVGWSWGTALGTISHRGGGGGDRWSACVV